MDRGFFLTLQAMRRQLAAMPCDYYQIRLIHGGSRKPFPGDRVGSAVQLTHRATVAFLRLRNREGYDIFFHPFAGNRNAGYILLDLDSADDQIIESMRANGHEPCVVLRTSPGHLQAWVRVSLTPLAPTVATSAAAHLAALYDADRASADWRHCGRLAGFTRNLHAVHLAGTLLGPSCCTHNLAWPPRPLRCWNPLRLCSRRLAILHHALAYPALSPPAGASRVYWRWLRRLQIPQRFSSPDWSIADLWIAQRLLRCRVPADQVRAVLRLGSPGFPRRHSHPEDYLHRTLARAAQEPSVPFPARLDASDPPP